MEPFARTEISPGFFVDFTRCGICYDGEFYERTAQQSVMCKIHCNDFACDCVLRSGVAGQNQYAGISDDICNNYFVLLWYAARKKSEKINRLF